MRRFLRFLRLLRLLKSIKVPKVVKFLLNNKENEIVPLQTGYIPYVIDNKKSKTSITHNVPKRKKI